MGRAVRQSGLIAPLSEPIAETGWREWLAILGDQKSHHPYHWRDGNGHCQRCGNRDVHLGAVLRRCVHEPTVPHVRWPKGDDIGAPLSRIYQ